MQRKHSILQELVVSLGGEQEIVFLVVVGVGGGGGGLFVNVVWGFRNGI